APAALRRCTTVASYGGTNSASIRDPAVVTTPWVQKLSLIATGTPASGPGSRPAATSWSIAAARSSADSAVTVVNALTAASVARIFSRCRLTTSTARQRPNRTPAASSAALSCVKSGSLIGGGPQHVRDYKEVVVSI